MGSFILGEMGPHDQKCFLNVVFWNLSRDNITDGEIFILNHNREY